MVKSKFKINPGAVIDNPGSSKSSKKVSFRNYRPVTDYSKCIKCARCWMFCPDMAFKRNKEGFFENIEEYCKGCGLCSKVCPVKCISRQEVKQ
jgi:pyruvate ferredoxin oxidoreductase delta subunit